jgi:hypothetical protein
MFVCNKFTSKSHKILHRHKQHNLEERVLPLYLSNLHLFLTYLSLYDYFAMCLLYSQYSYKSAC